ncbi:MAG TPA: caspase family protein [Burkholderiales bacterium]
MARKAARRKKAKGLALHLGLNSVDPGHYEGWDGPLLACELDAHDMSSLAKSRGMASTKLLTADATRARVLRSIRSAAKKLKKGDLFFLTFSGHGGQVADTSGDEDDLGELGDKKDETWCLFDGQLIDDELYLELSRFAAGVRILVLSDSCHSGTVVRAAPPITDPARPGARSRLMPPAVAERTYQAHRDFYDRLQRDVEKRAGKAAVADPDAALAEVAVSSRLTAIVKKFRPALILISGCQDNQTSMDGERNGAFTEQLLQVWNNGAFKGSYALFHAAIKSRLPATQTPNFFVLGPAGRFVRQAPFRL